MRAGFARGHDGRARRRRLWRASGAVSGSKAQSLTNRLWEGLSAHVYVYLHQARLSDVIGNQMTPCPAVPALFRVVDEDA